MASMDEQAALRLCETSLRSLMEHAYGRQFGDDWLMSVSNSEQRREWAKLADAAKAEQAQRGMVAVPDVGLAYSHLHDLIKIARKHWQPLEPALGDKHRVLALLGFFETLRNPTAHHRLLLPYEQEMYSGIAGMIRNKVTIFMSQADPSGDIYPRIESASDEFGRVIDLQWPGKMIAGMIGNWPGDQVITVRPDDLVKFTVSAVDPQDREIYWTLRYPMGYQVHQLSSSGVETVLEWTVNVGDHGDDQTVVICMEAHGARWHRSSAGDQQVNFGFRVAPPLDRL